MDWQTVVALLITVVAALVGIRYQWRQWTRAMHAGGCGGCRGCPQQAGNPQPPIPLVSLSGPDVRPAAPERERAL